jgi:hypothetical protein
LKTYTKTREFRVPLKTVVPVAVSILIAVGGVYYGWAQTQANSNVLLMAEKVHQLETEQSDQNGLITANTFAISDLKSSISSIGQKADMIYDIVRAEK